MARYYQGEDGGKLSKEAAEERAAREQWTSHAGRRGACTESLRRLRRFAREHPEEVALHIEKLVNIHFKWADEDSTSQDLYNGMEDIDVLLMLTKLL